MIRSIVTGLLVSISLTATPAVAGIFVVIPEIPGSSTEPMHVGEIVVSSFELLKGGQVFPKNGPKRCAGPSSKTQFAGIRVEKPSDVASAKLFMAAAKGTSFPTVKITMTNPATKGLPSDEYVLTNAFIGDYSANGDEDGGLTEAFTLYFSTLTYTHYDPEESATWNACEK